MRTFCIYRYLGRWTFYFASRLEWVLKMGSFVLLVGLMHCSVPEKPCKYDTECTVSQKPYCGGGLCKEFKPCGSNDDCTVSGKRVCVNGGCKECDNNEHCASRYCRADKTCAPVVSSEPELVVETTPEIVTEPDSSTKPDAAESSSESEPVTEVGPEPQPEPVPEPMCSNGSTRPCYPAGKNRCSVDSGGKFVCKGICAVGTENCVGGTWSGKCSGATEPTTEICNGKDDDCDGVIDNDFANLG